MRRVLSIVLMAAGAVLVTGVIVFMVALDLSLVNSIYFVITTMTTVGYGDINLAEASSLVKLFGVLVMLAGAASTAAAFGLMTDFLLAARIGSVFGPKVRKMENHVIVCGLGKVGLRVAEKLQRLSQDVVVIDLKEDNRFLAEAEALGVPVVSGDMRYDATLVAANVAKASCLVACTSEDLVNLEAALNARELNATIRVVLRVFDPGLARRIETGFGFETAFSTSALAAPAFAMAAVDPGVVGIVDIDGELMVNLEMQVKKGTKLDGMSAKQLRGQGELSLLMHKSAAGTRVMHPDADFSIGAGDTLLLCMAEPLRPAIVALNA